MFRLLSAALLCTVVAATCPPKGFDSIHDFDINAYVKGRWYIHQQAPTSYLPASQNFCVFAEYTMLAKKTFWGYDVHVHNHAEEKDGTVHDSDVNLKGGGIEAKIVDAKTGKLEVAPWFLPSFLAGPYWVIAYDEALGYALISGGAPKVDGENGLCRTGTGINSAGLWIFLRSQERNQDTIDKVRAIATAKGFDLSVLNDVDNSKCHSATTEGLLPAVVV